MKTYERRPKADIASGGISSARRNRRGNTRLKRESVRQLVVQKHWGGGGVGPESRSGRNSRDAHRHRETAGTSAAAAAASRGRTGTGGIPRGPTTRVGPGRRLRVGRGVDLAASGAARVCAAGDSLADRTGRGVRSHAFRLMASPPQGTLGEWDRQGRKGNRDGEEEPEHASIVTLGPGEIKMRQHFRSAT